MRESASAAAAAPAIATAGTCRRGPLGRRLAHHASCLRSALLVALARPTRRTAASGLRLEKERRWAEALGRRGAASDAEEEYVKARRARMRFTPFSLESRR